jgi:glycosyltransferase involved in cell wall biosynthesis
VALHQGAGSTIDHFLRLPLEKVNADFLEMDSQLKPNSAQKEILESCHVIIVVRYLPKEWIPVLSKARNLGVTLIYLMDDDLLDPMVIKKLPSIYKERVQKKIMNQRRIVPSLFDRVWVTSEYLQQKYKLLEIELLPLCPHSRLLMEYPRLQLAYFGTSVHQEEFDWLRILLESLQKRQENTYIDLFGDININRQFRDLPRLRIIHPMKWANYLTETGSGRIDILLSPLMESPVNAARAAVKFIDAARTGAAGLYSDRLPYKNFIRHGIDGLLLSDNHRDWINAIENLIQNPIKRQELASQARQRAFNFITHQKIVEAEHP